MKLTANGKVIMTKIMRKQSYPGHLKSYERSVLISWVSQNSVLCTGLTREQEKGKQGISTQEGCWTGNRWCNVANLSTHRKH